ncbi:MAG: TIGR00266 family protein [Eubacteriaceae bacterium]|nr:TIGR00266 family protein [Eubacteriaceae bacterium]
MALKYEIHGDDMQFIRFLLNQGESLIAEAGALLFMDSTLEMDTVFGDASGSNQGGGLMGKLMGAGKRAIMGESLFMTLFTQKNSSEGEIAFGAPYPGKIIPLNLSDYDGMVICQKDAFLCAEKGTSIDIAFQKKIGVGLFGGEGFIMEKIQGTGMTFFHAGGTIYERDLAPGETLKVDTGCLVALTKTVNYDIEMMKNVKTAIFGGEGLFFATLKGPGKVWLQSLPFSRLADRIISSSRKMGHAGKGEGGVMDVLGGLGNLLDGD